MTGVLEFAGALLFVLVIGSLLLGAGFLYIVYRVFDRVFSHMDEMESNMDSSIGIDNKDRFR